MKYVNFKRVKIQNFLSVGETPVEVDFNRGLNIITGSNKDKTDRRNGVGKSTVADSIYFAIFGDTLRTIKREHIINNSTQRNCCVELLFDINQNGSVVEYCVRRTLAPSKCYIYKDGDDITRDTIANTTGYIQDLLSTTPEIFQNCVIMTINNATPFMAKKKLDKRKFIEGIFNLRVFSDMLNDVRAEYNQVSKDLDIECARYEEISNTLNTQLEQKSGAEKDHKRQYDKLMTRKIHHQADLEAKEKVLGSIELIDIEPITKRIKSIEDYSPRIDNEIQKVISHESTCSTKIDIYKSKQSKLSTEHTTCPVCLSNLDDNHKELIIEEKQKLSSEIDELIEQKQKASSQLGVLNQGKQQLKIKKNAQRAILQKAQLQQGEIKTITEQINMFKSRIIDINDDIQSLESREFDHDIVINKTTRRLEELQQKIDEIKKSREKLDIIKFVVSEEGVKSYIVKKMLQLFNSKLQYYLKKMDSNCICIFNEYFEEEIINEKGNLCSYFNFSGAERKNIDLACLFAFMDIRRLQGDVAFNFSMYDELFDSSLDERGVELVIEILNERIDTLNECVMVISHRKESTKLATGEVIFLEKQNGITVRVETPVNELK